MAIPHPAGLASVHAGMPGESQARRGGFQPVIADFTVYTKSYSRVLMWYSVLSLRKSFPT